MLFRSSILLTLIAAIAPKTPAIGSTIPEASIENKALTTIGLIIGFITMMILDVALG